MNQPDRAGQAVKSNRGTLGITTSGVNSDGYIEVMFIGDIGTVPFRADRLELIELAEQN